MSQLPSACVLDGALAALRHAEARLREEAPDQATAAEGVGYLARLFSASLARAFNPAARVVGGLYYADHAMGGANPDYRIGQALINPQEAYRITGRLNGAARLAIGLYTPSAPFGLALDAYTSTDSLPIDGGGAFSVEIGPDVGPAGLRTSRSSVLLLTRELKLRPGDEAATIRLQSLETHARRASGYPPGAAEIAGMADRMASGFTGQFTEFLRWSRVIAAQPNTMTRLPAELDDAVRGDPDTHYGSGYFRLGEGQSLNLYVPPLKCRYWMVQALNHWLEPIEGANANLATARLEQDGSARFEIGPAQSGNGNWLDTRGRTCGALFFRTVGNDQSIIPGASLNR